MRMYEKEIKSIGYNLELSKDELLEFQYLLDHGIDAWKLDSQMKSMYVKLCYLVNDILDEED